MRWQSFPATETTLRSFAAYLADQVSFKIIKLYLAGIRFAHTENSLPDPFQEAPLIHLLLHGIKRIVGLSSRQRYPITVTLLRQIKEELARAPDFLPSDKLMLWSAFTLAFHGFLRSSKFTSPYTTQFNPLVHLCFTDVSFTSKGCLALHLKSFKTDPYHQGCSLLIAPFLHSVCAVRTLRKYLSLRSVSGASPLYVFQSGAYLTRATVTLTLRTLLQHLSIPTQLYTSHSFRIGAATTPAEAGLPPWLIQTLGCWSSNCFTLYIQTPPSILQKVPGMLAASRPSGQGYVTRYQGAAPVVFHNGLVMLAVFGIFFGCILATFTCMKQAGWDPYPTLAFTHSWVGHAPHSLAQPLPWRVCRCHPYFITHF